MPVKINGATSGGVTLDVPAVAGSNTLTLPARTATVATNNHGIAAPVGASTDDLFYENSKAVSANYTISTNKCAMSTGPITINSGVSVTIPSGSRWVII